MMQKVLGVEGKWEIGCDACPDSDEENAATFMGALGAFKRRGWRVVHDRGAYEHRCPSCVEAWVAAEKEAAKKEAGSQQS